MIIKVLIVLLFLILPSCNKPQKGTLVIADTDKINASTGLTSSVIGDMIFSPVLYNGNGLVFHNLLAEEVRTLSGGKAIEVKIRKGVRFHDGREITASDVAASLNGIMERDKYLKERAGTLRVAVIDESRITVTGEKPISDLYALLEYTYVYSNNLTGTGPYKFAKWLENGVELMANDDYFEGAPKLKKVVYRYEPDERKRVNMLLKGEADLLVWLSPEMADFLKEDDKFYVKGWPIGFYSAIFLNNESHLFRDKTLRKAVSMAIDRDKLIKKVLNGGGIRTLSPFHPQTFHSENITASTGYRPGEAVRLLKDAGWRDADGDGILEKNGIKLMFRLYYNSNVEEFKKMTDIISQDLFEVGMGVEAIPADIGESTDRNFEAGTYDAVLEGKATSESVNMLTWDSSSLFNMSHFNNREMDTLLNRLRDAANIEQKEAIYGKMQRIFEEEAPAAFIYAPVIYTAASKRFKGAEDFVGNVYSIYKIKDWSVNE